jgi:hypothetical protein
VPPVTDADDKESVDRAFAEMIAGYHLTSDRPDHQWEGPPPGRPPAPGSVFETPTPRPSARPPGPAAPRPLPPPEPDDDVDPGPVDAYQPGAAAPLPRPAWPVLIGWLALGYAVLTVLAIAVGIMLPVWAAWAGILGFVGGFALLVSRLPRQRPPDAGDGAVL